MNKIFISILTLAILGVIKPVAARCIGLDCPQEYRDPTAVERLDMAWEDFKSSDVWKSDNEKYWMNKFRNYRKYPIKFYTEEDLHVSSGVDNVRTVIVNEYPRYKPIYARKGQRMFDYTTYTITYKSGSGERYRLDKDAVLFAKSDSIRISKDMVLRPIGEVYVNGEYFMLLELPHTSYVIAVDTHGNVSPMIGQISDRGYFLLARDMPHIKPEWVVAVPYSDSTETESRPVFNFDVTYAGIENREILLTIKDGSGEEQTRAVPLYKNMVIVNGTKFQIIYANPDYIEYQIVD